MPRILALLLVVTTAHAYVIHNETRRTVTIVVGDFDPVACAPGENVSRSWEGFADSRDERLRVRITCDSFQSDVTLYANGWIDITEVVEAEGMPAQLAVHSYFRPDTSADRVLMVDSDARLSVPEARQVAFLITGDTQYNQHDRSNQEVRKYLSDATVRELRDRFDSDPNIRGILVAGDLTQFAVESEFEEYTEAIGNHSEHFYEGLGNHDFDPKSFELNADVHDELQRYIVRKRRGTLLREQWDIHYSWDWHDVHFVQLNLAPFDGDLATSRYEEGRDALTFLQLDLERHVGSSGRPVVLISHVGPNDSRVPYWGPTQAEADRRIVEVWNALRTYNVVGWFYGHIHNRTTGWAGPFERSDADADTAIARTRPDGRTAIATFVTGGACNGDDDHDGSGTNYFLSCTIDDELLTVTRHSVDWTGWTNDDFWDSDDFHFRHVVDEPGDPRWPRVDRGTRHVELFPDRFGLGIEDDVFGPHTYTHSEPRWVYSDGPVADLRYGDDVVYSPPLGENGRAWFELTVQGPKTLGFAWKLDAAHGDVLHLRDNGVSVRSLTGKVAGFPSVRYEVPAGTHRLRWSYEKDGRFSEGLDRAWVDRIVLIGDVLGAALDQPALSFNPVPSGSAAPWDKVALAGRSGGFAARSGKIGDRQKSSIVAELPGPALLAFDWKVSSEPERDELYFALNTMVREKLSGESGWQTVRAVMPRASNPVLWTYQKDGSGQAGDDAAWIDNVRITPIAGTAAEGLDLPPGIEPGFEGEGLWYGALEGADGDAASVAPLTGSKTATLTVPLVGPGVVRWRWRCDGGEGPGGADQLHASLRLEISNNPFGGEVLLASVEGQTGWEELHREIPAGNFVLAFAFYKRPGTTGGQGTAFLDGFSFVPGAQVPGVEPVTAGLDCPRDIFVTGGAGAWYGQKDDSHGGRDSATHLRIGDAESTWIQTVLEGPRVVEFSWKISSQVGRDYGRFHLDGVQQLETSGIRPWSRHRIELPAGLHTLRWSYTKDRRLDAGEDRLWLDGIAIHRADFGVDAIKPDVGGTRVRVLGDTFVDAVGQTRGRAGYILEARADGGDWELVADHIVVNHRGVGIVKHAHAEDAAPAEYRLRWEPERRVPLRNAGFEEQAVADRSFSYRVPGWKEDAARSSFTENIRGAFAPEGENDLGLANGVGLGLLSPMTDLRGRLTLDVAVGHRPGHTVGGNSSQYGFSDRAAGGFLFAHPHHDWWFHGKSFVDASEQEAGTWVEAPALTQDIRGPELFHQEGVFLRAGGKGRAHFDDVRLWLEPW